MHSGTGREQPRVLVTVSPPRSTETPALCPADPPAPSRLCDSGFPQPAGRPPGSTRKGAAWPPAHPTGRPRGLRQSRLLYQLHALQGKTTVKHHCPQTRHLSKVESLHSRTDCDATRDTLLPATRLESLCVTDLSRARAQGPGWQAVCPGRQAEGETRCNTASEVCSRPCGGRFRLWGER